MKQINQKTAVPLSRLKRSLECVRSAQRHMILMSIAIEQADDTQAKIDPARIQPLVDEAVRDLEEILRLMRSISPEELRIEARRGQKPGPRFTGGSAKSREAVVDQRSRKVV